MIEVVKIEDFVINQLFKPYTPSLIPHERSGKDKTNKADGNKTKEKSGKDYGDFR